MEELTPMKRILCFGDSNTYGFCAEPCGGRYAFEHRWPGILQGKLSHAAQVMEAGANGRTLFQEDSQFEGCFGTDVLKQLLLTLKAPDILTVMLGTNDLKTRYGLLPRDIADGLQRLVSLAQSLAPGMRILLIAPVFLESKALTVFLSNPFSKDSYRHSRMLGPLYSDIARKNGCLFLDASTVTNAGNDDGVHLDRQGHGRLADAVYQALLPLL